MCPTPWDVPEPHGNVPELTGCAQAPWDVPEPMGTRSSPMGHVQAPQDVPGSPRPCPTTPGWTHLLVFAEVAIQLVEVGGTLGGHGQEDG